MDCNPQNVLGSLMKSEPGGLKTQIFTVLLSNNIFLGAFFEISHVFF